jgi:hypothetical protein
MAAKLENIIPAFYKTPEINTLFTNAFLPSVFDHAISVHKLPSFVSHCDGLYPEAI